MTVRICDFPDCGRPHMSRGYCSAHYEQLTRRHGGDASRLTPLGTRQRTDHADRVEDAVELLNRGVDPEEVATRLGTNVVALEMLTRRHGQPRADLMRAARAAPRRLGTKADLCRNGHDRAVVGVYTRADGGQSCKQCQRDAERRYVERRKAGRAARREGRTPAAPDYVVRHEAAMAAINAALTPVAFGLWAGQGRGRYLEWHVDCPACKATDYYPTEDAAIEAAESHECKETP